MGNSLLSTQVIGKGRLTATGVDRATNFLFQKKRSAMSPIKQFSSSSCSSSRRPVGSRAGGGADPGEVAGSEQTGHPALHAGIRRREDG